jgi:hypothetical protein
MAFKIATEKKGSKTQEIETPSAISKKIAEYVSLKEQSKDIEAKLKALSVEIREFADTEHGKRLASGISENFKLEGDGGMMVNFIAQERGSAILADEAECLRKEFGKIVDDAIEVDFASFKLNPEVTGDASKLSKIEKALDKLSKEFGQEVLLPGTYKVRKGILQLVKELKTEKKINAFLNGIKLSRYIK